jgi:carbamoyltransferase
MDVKNDGSFRLNLDYLDYCTGLKMTNRKFDDLFEGPPRKPEEPITQRHMDVAASIQKVLQDVVLRMTRALATETGAKNLCLAGGVALNCVANGHVLRDGRFERIWIQPASGDAGGALGAALAAYYMYQGRPRETGGCDTMSGAYLGPAFSQQEIERRLREAGARFEVLRHQELLRRSAEAIEAGKALGWFQGRMEFGPRALGARSILADARSPAMQSTLNRKIKYRESFRPFAPSVLREHVADWFEMDADSPYMLLVAPLAERRRKPRSEIPAVTHVDYSARIQTVHRETNPLFAELLSAFHQRTGCPLVVNTSFNIRGEPIVCTPEDAFRCFMGTQMEALAIGDCFLEKNDQNAALAVEYAEQFEPD